MRNTSRNIRTLLFPALIAGALLLTLPGCSDNEAAKRVAESHGFTNVVPTGYRWTGCSESDNVRTGFRATNAQGRPVTGAVCNQWALWGKTYTLRLD